MSDTEQYAVSKVLVMAGKWYDCRINLIPLRNGPQRERVRALGNYETAGENLACSVEELRKASKAHHG